MVYTHSRLVILFFALLPILSWSQSIEGTFYAPIVFSTDRIDVSAGLDAQSLEYSSGTVSLGVLQPRADPQSIIPELIVYELITPAIQDGLNDVWEIRRLDRIANYKIMVFDQWEHLVFESEDYGNDWAAEGLSTGIYRYVVKDLDNQKNYVGSLRIEL